MSIDTTRPAYRVLAVSGFFGPDDNLYQLDEEIYFDGEPNEELEPITPPALERMRSYLEKLDALGREVATKTGKAYAGRPRSIDGALEMATAVAMADRSIMGAAKQNTGIEAIEKSASVPQTGSIRPKARGKKPSLAA